MIKSTNNELKTKNADLIHKTGEMEDEMKTFKREIMELK